MPLFYKQGIDEHTIERDSTWAKETISSLVPHERATGTELPGSDKFCQDVCIPEDAAPIPIKKSNIPNIRQIAVPAADTEFEIVLPINLQQVLIKDQEGGNGSAFRVSTIAGGADPADLTFFTVPDDSSLHWDNLNLTAVRTLYCQTEDDPRIIEIWEWLG